MKDILGGLLMLVLVFGGGYCTGKHYEQEAQQAEVDRLNTEARAKEKALADAVTTTANALRVSNEKAKMATKQRDAAIDSGALKLRVPVKTSCAVPASTDTATAAGDSGGEARSELDPAFGKALFAIAEEGDRAITKLNACISLYNQALESQKGIK
jgi:septal ring-binding cell division protein DamX